MKTLGAWPTENGPTYKVRFKSLDDELKFLRNTVTHFRQVPEIRNLALEIVRNSNAVSRDKRAQALEIARWVQHEIYYIHELPERFQTPTETLRLRAGDCDDSTTLIASLLESVGIPSRLVVMRINGAWSHIFPAAILKEGLLPLDSTGTMDVSEVTNPVKWVQARGRKVDALKMG